MAEANGPLAGLTVIDVTHMLSGPYCTWLLGALGANVIKIEHPQRGDMTRSIAPFHEGQSLYFGSVNRNKRSVGLDLKTGQGKDIFRHMASSADILVENNRPGVMDRLGLGFEDLRALNERLIFASISGFGQTGPYRTRPAFDAVIQAMSGMMSITGEPGGGPVRVGASIGDITASLFGAVGILAALQERSRTGRGTLVDVSMLDAQVAILENAFSRFLNTGQVPQRIGSRHPLVTPFQAFMAEDAPLVICCDTDQQWRALCRVLALHDLPEDPRFADGTARTANHPALEQILAEALGKRPRAEWLALFEEADVPAGPLNSIADSAEDAQLAARKMFVEVGSARFTAAPIRMASLEAHEERPAPEKGADGPSVLAEYGYSETEIASFRAAGVI
ncbi:CoA:oxalate CoA-transferase [Rhodoligotrophos appendicifer]|uniref:CaiB/BaiF CoA transferase family protein n=1 Tax=Rhodoligotrophos appendicifer TaxID=987056 RepID=UPI00195F8620|nr:CaiB/BaiF CoA-transferase family protein [Rhodoligotrophos appendicifer]